MANDRTDGRRERVKELYAKSNRRIGEVLVEEGFFGVPPKTPAGRARQIDTARRQVARDRDWWRDQWKKARNVTTEDRSVSTEEYVAKLETRIEQVEEVLDSPMMKGTPRVQALAELRQLEQAIGKARGVGEPASLMPEDGDGTKVPFLGIVVGLGKLSAEAIRKINEWNSDSDED
jgi:hypothetical protein